MRRSLFLAAVEATAKTVRTLLTTPQLTRPFREPFTPECLRGEEWLAEAEVDTEAAEGYRRLAADPDYQEEQQQLRLRSRRDRERMLREARLDAEAEAEIEAWDTPLSADYDDEPDSNLTALRERLQYLAQSPVASAGAGPVAPEEARPEPASSGVLGAIVATLGKHRYSPVNHSSIGSADHCSCGERPWTEQSWRKHVAPLIAAALDGVS